MKPLPLMAGLGATLLPQGALFLVQSQFVLVGDYASVLALAKYTGLLSMLFFLLDGNSGLVHSIVRHQVEPRRLAASFALYRLHVLALLAVLLVPAVLAFPAEVLVLLPWLAVALALRLPWLDGPLDQRGRQPLAVLLNAAWMVWLAGLAASTGRIDAQIAGMAALLGSTTLAAGRLLALRRGDTIVPARPDRHATAFIWHQLASFGLGLLYGRTVLFLIGASFAGPLAAVTLYGKQVFNASGLVVNYFRRAETATASDRTVTLRNLRSSVMTQALIAVPCAVIVIAAAWTTGLAAPLVLLILLWQLLERMFSNGLYVLQRLQRQGLAFFCLAVLAASGLLGVMAGLPMRSVIPFLFAESAAFLLPVIVLARLHWRRPALHGLAS